jgi:plasmid maintenance system killer protein
MDKSTTKSTFTEYLIPLPVGKYFESIQSLGLDKYTKKLDSLTFLKLFVFAQLKQLPSLADISLQVKMKEKLQEELQLESISASQLSRKMRQIPPDLFESVLTDLVQKISQTLGIRKATEQLRRLNLIDSSTISMCLSQYRWAEFRKTKAGVKVHLRVAFDEGQVYPDKAILTPAKPSDKTKLNELIIEESEAMHVFDRAYVDYKKFDEYSVKSIRFVTRLKKNADIEVLKELSVSPNSGVLRYAIVRLGSPYMYQTEHELLLIETVDSEGNVIKIVTNDWSLTDQEISDIYRNRWKIELFFKWIKQHLRVKKFYGTSENAVYNQIHIALITFCLSLLMQIKTEAKDTLLHLHTMLQLCWADPFPSFLKKLCRKRRRTSKGRQKWNPEKIYKETL